MGIIMNQVEWQEFKEYIEFNYLPGFNHLNVDFFINEDNLPFSPAEEIHFSLKGDNEISLIIDSNSEMHISNSNLDKFNTMAASLEAINLDFIEIMLQNANLKENAKRFK